MYIPAVDGWSPECAMQHRSVEVNERISPAKAQQLRKHSGTSSHELVQFLYSSPS